MYADKVKKELYDFYLTGDAERSKAFAEHCFSIMDSRYKEDMSVTALKLLQYDVITEEFTPVLFKSVPFYYETGVLTSLSDGTAWAKSLNFNQANGWATSKNKDVFVEQDGELFKLKCAHAKNILYLICGPYNDLKQHYNFNCRPFLEGGLKSVYEKAEAEIKNAKNDQEREFLNSVCQGMLALKKVAEKFSKKAEEMLCAETDESAIENLTLIRDTAKRVPWNKPETFYEALNTMAFMRTAMGSLEGVGPNTFGRLDKDLIEFYENDIKNGVLTKEKAYELVSQFLLIWDCHYDHDMLMAGYADHELENTYVLGGCDDDGNPLYNEVTEMFLRATREYTIIFPKIKCRFSKDSPKEYLDEVNKAIVAGTSTVLLQNDDASIPAIVRSGKTLEEARDYLVTGCWGFALSQEKFDHGSYLNLMKAFELPLHNCDDIINEIQIDFEKFDDCATFEEFYSRTVRNCEKLLDAKLMITKKGGQIFHKYDRLPIFSSTLENCIENHKDYTQRGAKYNDDYQLMFGFPNIIDSLLAVKTLVFDTKKYTFDEMLSAVRTNWENNEDMRIEATRCHGWGDGSKESNELATRFYDDLYEMCQRKTGTYGGKVHMGHLTYTEIIWWGEKTLATPDGRKNGEYFAQGLTPSRLKRIPNVADVINSMKCLDGSKMGANSVVNIILPSNISLERCENFLRVIATTAIQSLQLNCVSKEVLLDAQKNPEKYPDLIVRVTGFSAKFTSLSPTWQQEVISRNFYD